MPQVVVLAIAASATALATGLGAIPVFLLGDRAARLTPVLLGFAAGVMGVASVAGLLIPATEEGSALAVVAGLAVGGGVLGVARRRLDADHGFMGRTGPAPAPRRWSSPSSSSTASRRAWRSAPPSPPIAPASASS